MNIADKSWQTIEGSNFDPHFVFYSTAVIKYPYYENTEVENQLIMIGGHGQYERPRVID